MVTEPLASSNIVKTNRAGRSCRGAYENTLVSHVDGKWNGEGRFRLAGLPDPPLVYHIGQPFQSEECRVCHVMQQRPLFGHQTLDTATSKGLVRFAPQCRDK